ncbi:MULTISPECIES: hypothetical protein [Vibrio]|uniref:Uncharacterized protein n=2 Tax=Vibrio TaxID=662 RepID=A0A510IFC8_9VIBR|nr:MULTISPECIES: hypothetical protein [Vibrio]RTZ24628.1 hypothetical protein EKN09_02920 [Vibrio penaeicida]BBL92257.1 hypothetical protein VroAM7_49100 [Vibrio rotiferianus]GLQ71128.1 hypothetical protein GCM10007932_04880 [Vibrio penaeicida]
MDEILRKGKKDSCTEEFIEASYNFQIENYDLRKALCSIPLYQNLMVKKIVEYTNGIHILEESVSATEVDILRGLSFNFKIAKSQPRKLSGIIHDFNYQDPRFERKSMGRNASERDKELSAGRFNAICSYLNDTNSMTYEVYKGWNKVTFVSGLTAYETIMQRNTNLADLMCQITPKRSYCVLHQAVMNCVCEFVETTIHEVFREFKVVYESTQRRDIYANVSELTLDKAFHLILSRKSKRKAVEISNLIEVKLAENRDYINALQSLGIPLSNREKSKRANIFNKSILETLYKVYCLNKSVKDFKDLALSNLPYKITKEISKIVPANRKSDELTESLRAACLEEVLIILDQWNTKYELIQFADMYIKRTIKERLKAETSAVDKSIDNKKQKLSRLLNSIIDKGRASGEFISMHSAKETLKKLIAINEITGIKERDVDNHVEENFGTESLDLHLTNGFELSSEFEFEDEVVQGSTDEYSIVTELLAKLKRRERVILTKLLAESSNQNMASFKRHLKACVKDDSHGLDEALLKKFETIVREMQ